MSLRLNYELLESRNRCLTHGGHSVNMPRTDSDFPLRCGIQLQQTCCKPKTGAQILTQGLTTRKKTAATSCSYCSAILSSEDRLNATCWKRACNHSWWTPLLSLVYRWTRWLRGILAQTLKLSSADLRFKIRPILKAMPLNTRSGI